MRQIDSIYSQAGDKPLTQRQESAIRVLRAEYRAVTGARRPKRQKVKREPANVTPIRSVVSGGLPGLGKRR